MLYIFATMLHLRVFRVNSDLYGSSAALLCMAHCLATPFLFIVQAGHAKYSCVGPTWWTSIDFVFLLIAGLAVFHSARNAVLSWLPFVLSFFMLALAFGVIAPSFSEIMILEKLKWLGAIGLVIFHVVNYKYCRCAYNPYCLEESVLEPGAYHFQKAESHE